MHNSPHRILLIAKRDYLATIRTKAFIIGLVVAPVLFGGGFLGIALIESKPDIKERRIAIVDPTGIAAPAVIQAAKDQNAKDLFDKTTHRQVEPRYVFETLSPAADPKAQRLALSERVRRQQLFAFVEIGPHVFDAAPPTSEDSKAAGPVATYSNAGGFDDASRWLSGSINEGIRRVRLAQLGVDPSRLPVRACLRQGGPLRPGLARSEDRRDSARPGKKNEGAEFGVPFGIMLLLGMIVMVGSSPMLSAVTEDKAQRLVEMLLGIGDAFRADDGQGAGRTGHVPDQFRVLHHWRHAGAGGDGPSPASCLSRCSLGFTLTSSLT